MLRTKQHVVKKTEQEWMQMEATIGGLVKWRSEQSNPNLNRITFFTVLFQ